MDQQQNQQPGVEPVPVSDQPANQPIQVVAPPSQPTQMQPIMQAQQPMVAQTPQAMPVSASQMQAKKSKLGLILGLIIGLFILVAGSAVALYILVLSPAAQSKKASKAFMSAATSGDLEKLYVLDDATDAESKTFLKNASESVRGSYKQTTSKSKDNKWYYSYTIEGAKSKYARTIVEKMSGKWVVTSIVYGANPLASIPADPVASTDAQPDMKIENTPAVATPTTAQSCLTQDDYKYMNYDKQPSSVTYDATYNPPSTFNYSANMYFEPDSTAETSLGSVYDDWADFGTHMSAKQWNFHLRGTVYVKGANSLANPEAIALSNSRAEKVKNALVSRGVAADRIIIDSPINNADEYQDGYDSIFRRVEIDIDPTCTSAK